MEDGQSVLLDDSSSAMYMIPYIREHKDMTVISNNMKTVLNAVQMGIRAFCLGGEAFEGSSVLLGPTCERSVEFFCPDILFFSTQYLSEDGWLTDYSLEEVSLRQVLIKNVKKNVFLCDSDKIGQTALHRVCHIASLQNVIFESSQLAEKYGEFTNAL